MKDREKGLTRELIQLIINHDFDAGEAALIDSCIPLINDGAYLAYIDENDMTAVDWARLFNYDTLQLLLCNTIAGDPDIDRSRKRDILEEAFQSAGSQTLRQTLSDYWKKATLSSFEKERLHKREDDDPRRDPPPSSQPPSGPSAF